MVYSEAPFFSAEQRANLKKKEVDIKYLMRERYRISKINDVI